MKVTGKALVLMLLWTVVAMFAARWLNGLDLGPQWAHVALNLLVWFGGWAVILWLVMRRAKPSDFRVSASTRLAVMAWAVVLLAVAMVAIATAITRGEPFWRLMASPLVHDRRIAFVSFALDLFGLALACVAGLSFWILRDPTQRRCRLLDWALWALVLTNVLVVMTGFFDGSALPVSSLVIGVPLRRYLPVYARSVLEEARRG